MKKTWDKGELIAINYLKDKWYEIIETNFKFWRIWEIDIIAKLKNKFIFVEVKYRNNSNYWSGLESITKTKLRKIFKTINFYAYTHKIDESLLQFDVINIQKLQKSYKLTHLKNLWLE